MARKTALTLWLPDSLCIAGCCSDLVGTQPPTTSTTNPPPTSAYEVDLTWDAPTASSESVAGYNIYRAASESSMYQLLNSSIESSTSYSDTTAANNTCYTYYVESVDAEGNQSEPSNTYTVSIP